MVFYLNEIDGYVKLSKEHIESSLVLLEAKKYRSSVSSSYYAMFSIAKALLVKEGIETQKHSGVTSFFGQYIVKDKGFDKAVYKYLIRAKTSRKQADYEQDYIVTEEEAKKTYNRALIFIKEAKKFLS